MMKRNSKQFAKQSNKESVGGTPKFNMPAGMKTIGKSQFQNIDFSAGADSSSKQSIDNLSFLSRDINKFSQKKSKSFNFKRGVTPEVSHLQINDAASKSGSHSFSRQNLHSSRSRSRSKPSVSENNKVSSSSESERSVCIQG